MTEQSSTTSLFVSCQPDLFSWGLGLFLSFAHFWKIPGSKYVLGIENGQCWSFEGLKVSQTVLLKNSSRPKNQMDEFSSKMDWLMTSLYDCFTEISSDVIIWSFRQTCFDFSSKMRILKFLGQYTLYHQVLPKRIHSWKKWVVWFCE